MKGRDLLEFLTLLYTADASADVKLKEDIKDFVVTIQPDTPTNRQKAHLYIDFKRQQVVFIGERK